MIAKLSKIRCFTCLKKILIPDIFSVNENTLLYFNNKNFEFSYYKFSDNLKLERIAIELLNTNKIWIAENDDTKGNKYKWIIGKLSNSQIEPYFGVIDCPRCKLNFQSTPKKSDELITLKKLNFTFLQEQTEYLKKMSKALQLKEKTNSSFIVECKKLYLMSIHPFDPNKLDTEEYKNIMNLGESLILEQGIHSFMQYDMESQYRIYIWTALITLTFGGKELNEPIDQLNSKTIKEQCLEIINKDEVPNNSKQITEYKNNWIKKTFYNTV